ncbi:MAG TPA: hypothetical protein PKI14_08870 [Fervidobacterium sp.]|nr:hypothetical protein [Fervidobacterium sp.]HPT54012.1 hypothetical protein [Fervidobacterium sp.]HPZ18032.1 hypothetical protein [Fervidobacterium sp.]HRD20250.1 hypothetical protein [Fervidobacterium sp.]HUM43046.1 hypothetical protein [Fervidobacterium sp.]
MINTRDREKRERKEKKKLIKMINYHLDTKPLDSISPFVKKLTLYALLFALGEFVFFAFVSLWNSVMGLLIGTVGMMLGMVFIGKSYEDYGIILLGKRKIPKLYFLRYLLYASLFLLSAIIATEPAWAILGVFLGMMNFKIVIFLFAWRW